MQLGKGTAFIAIQERKTFSAKLDLLFVKRLFIFRVEEKREEMREELPSSMM